MRLRCSAVHVKGEGRGEVKHRKRTFSVHQPHSPRLSHCKVTVYLCINTLDVSALSDHRQASNQVCVFGQEDLRYIHAVKEHHTERVSEFVAWRLDCQSSGHPYIGA